MQLYFGKKVDEFGRRVNENITLKNLIQFNFTGLGWMTKWDKFDIRLEYNPVWMIIVFGYQMTLTFTNEHDTDYWETWLYYDLFTKGSRMERIEQCREGHSLLKVEYDGEKFIKEDDYKHVLRPRYL